MNHKIIISQKLMDKFKNVNFTEQAWIDVSIKNTNELIDSILCKINSYNSKLKVNSIEIGETNGGTNIHKSHILDENNRIIAYVFFISPGSMGRNIFLSQQAYSGLQNIFEEFCQKSISNDLFNKPVYIINTNQDDLTDLKKLLIKGAKTIGIHYIDIFNNELFESYKNIADYNDATIALPSRSKGKKWFYIDEANKTVKFITKDDKGNWTKFGTSGRYQLLSRQLPAMYLASLNNYECDIDEIKLHPEKDTVNSIINYYKKLYTL
jgi:hypothetical protein